MILQGTFVLPVFFPFHALKIWGIFCFFVNYLCYNGMDIKFFYLLTNF